MNELRGIWLPYRAKLRINYLSVLLLIIDPSINEMPIDTIIGRISDDKRPNTPFYKYLLIIIF